MRPWKVPRRGVVQCTAKNTNRPCVLNELGPVHPQHLEHHVLMTIDSCASSAHVRHVIALVKLDRANRSLLPLRDIGFRNFTLTRNNVCKITILYVYANTIVEIHSYILMYLLLLVIQIVTELLSLNRIKAEACNRSKIDAYW